VALDCALSQPDRVAGLILLAPGVRGAPAPELDRDTQRFSDLIDQAIAAGDLDEINWLETWLWLGGPGSAEGRVGGEARRLTLEMNAIVLRHDVPHDLERSPAADAWQRLGEVVAPTIVACGELDLPLQLAQSRGIADRVPRAVHQVLPGMAHLANVEQPRAIANLVLESTARA